MKALQHFITITHHKLYVMRHCFCVGLYWQGICHDLSKYMPSEFGIGCKYYQGDRSPNNAEREATGCSTAWLHHKGRNKHHYEYWIDYGPAIPGMPGMIPMKMPKKYVVEMFMDRVAASKIYLKSKYTDSAALEYYKNGLAIGMIHDDTRALLEEMLYMLAEKGEKYTFAHIKNHILKSDQY